MNPQDRKKDNALDDEKEKIRAGDKIVTVPFAKPFLGFLKVSGPEFLSSDLLFLKVRERHGRSKPLKFEQSGPAASTCKRSHSFMLGTQIEGKKKREREIISQTLATNDFSMSLPSGFVFDFSNSASFQLLFLQD